jgi:hypothetical protein
LSAPNVPVMSAHSACNRHNLCPADPALVISASRNMPDATSISAAKAFVTYTADIACDCRNHRRHGVPRSSTELALAVCVRRRFVAPCRFSSSEARDSGGTPCQKGRAAPSCKTRIPPQFQVARYFATVRRTRRTVANARQLPCSEVRVTPCQSVRISLDIKLAKGTPLDML